MKNIGTKYALLIGNNYSGSNSLRGCHNDIDRIETRLTNSNNINVFSNFKKSNMDILKDANRNEILNGFDNLINKINLEKNFDDEWFSCIVFIHFSGHGTWIKDTNNDEIDNKDECIVGNNNSIITDDEIYNKLSNIYNPNAKIIICFDCCHSGTGIDLGYLYNRSNKKYELTNRKLTNIKPNIIFFSGCKDEQTSADAYLRELSEFGGAFTDSFLDKGVNNKDIFDYLEDNNSSLSNIVDIINNYMIMNSFTQRPCLSTNMTNAIVDNDHFDNINILENFFINKEQNNNIQFNITPNHTNTEVISGEQSLIELNNITNDNPVIINNNNNEHEFDDNNGNDGNDDDDYYDEDDDNNEYEEQPIYRIYKWFKLQLRTLYNRFCCWY